MAAAAISSDPRSPAVDLNAHTTTFHEKQPAANNAHDHLHTSQVHTPPTTDEANSHKDDDAASTSSLSDLGDIEMEHDLDMDMDIDVDMDEESNRRRFEDAARAGAEAEKDAEVKPDRYENGVPIFTPTMDQFKDFEKYVQGVDAYGMQSGIVLIDPPEEWKRARKPLDDLVKNIKIKNPITQEFHGAQGIYTQRNMEKMRSYNLPQWKGICEQTENQPPAKRGEKRMNADKLLGRGSARSRKSESVTPAATSSSKRRPGRPPKIKKDETIADDSTLAAPPTPTSPEFKAATPIKTEEGGDEEMVDAPVQKGKRSRKPGAKPRGRQPKTSVKKESGGKSSETTVAARRLRNATAAADEIDEEAFEGFDYRVHDNDQFTAERCDELEEKYWKSLNFSNPMYAADMPGSLFDEDTKEWNVAKLPNLLDLLGQPIPGVNTAYLYLGMWRATFAWHLEDVDLYSINYIHFGAPKQWYSISQKDAPKFEAAMRSIWSQDAKNCDQFLRHKTYLVSPSLLKSKFGVNVNKVVHREGQFVITFPIGYHSGYNLGYNCAESVNFAIPNWLQYGKTARKCQCEADSVFIDVDWFVRRLNGEPSPEFEEVEVTDDEDDMDDVADLPTPPGSDHGKLKVPSKRKRAPKDLGPSKKAKKIVKVRKASRNQPCCLCPNDFAWEELLPTTHGQRAHRTCAMYTPETYIATQDGDEKVFNVEGISKARLDLRCHECKQKKGSCFQCSSAKCTRAYHATCAMQAGVQVDKGEIAVWHEGVEYRDVGFDWRCRLHRTVKRTRITSELSTCNHSNHFSDNKEFLNHLAALKHGDLIQYQSTNSDDIEAGVVLSSYDDGTGVILVSVLPEQRKLREVEASSILFVDSSTSCLQKPTANALDLPEELQGKAASSSGLSERKPSEGDPFTEDPKTEWAEFVSSTPPFNKAQKNVDLSRDKQVWHYLPKTSTETKAQYTADPRSLVYDPASNFLDTVEPAKATMAPPPQPRRQSLAASYPVINVAARNTAMSHMRRQMAGQLSQGNIPHTQGQAQHSFMNSTKQQMMQEQQAQQAQQTGQQLKPSQQRDIVAAAEARANEQARILQRQQAKAQQLDLKNQNPNSSVNGIGIDQQSVQRQKEFQQQASQQSRTMSQQPLPAQHFNTISTSPLQQYNDALPNYHAADAIMKYRSYSMTNGARPQHFQYCNDWMNSHSASLTSPFNPLTSPAMPQMKSESPQLEHSPIIAFPTLTQQSSSPAAFQTPSASQHGHSAPESNAINDLVARQTELNRMEGIRTAASQLIPPRTPTEIERRRRMSNPAYPFKSPEQIAAQKEERERTGSQSSGSRPTSRPGSGYTTTALPSPGLNAVPFGPDPQNPPMFINPNATQISPPATSAGRRSKSGSVSGRIGPMGPPTQPMPPFKRSMSSGNMNAPNFGVMSGLGSFNSSAQSLSALNQPFSRPIPRPLMAPQPRTQLPDAPMAEPSPALVASLEPRPIHPDSTPKNDQPVPNVLLDWKARNNFWGRVAGHFARKHERSATVYKSPFGRGSTVKVQMVGPILIGSGDGLAGRYYNTLDNASRREIDNYRQHHMGRRR